VLARKARKLRPCVKHKLLMNHLLHAISTLPKRLKAQPQRRLDTAKPLHMTVGKMLRRVDYHQDTGQQSNDKSSGSGLTTLNHAAAHSTGERCKDTPDVTLFDWVDDDDSFIKFVFHHGSEKLRGIRGDNVLGKGDRTMLGKRSGGAKDGEAKKPKLEGNDLVITI
jgi:hypothetical protein